MKKKINILAVSVLALLTGATSAHAQMFAPPPQAAKPAKELAPYDLTGYWVSIISENWRFRIMAAPKGDFEGIFLTRKGAEIANAWDPAADDANGLACKSYGGAALMQLPTRLHISWADDNTLKFETDAGQQVRLAKFGATPPAPAERTWQGVTSAQWETRGGADFGPNARPIGLMTVTTGLKPGYVRRNGVPYGENAVVTEYYDLLPGPNGIQYLTVKTIVVDPEYLTAPYVTSANFKRIPDKSGWDPQSCRAR